METKQCKICNEVKNLSDFYYRKDKDIYRSECKICGKKYQQEYQNKYYSVNKELQNEKHKEYQHDLKGMTIKCEACNIEITQLYYPQHLKTKSHLKKVSGDKEDSVIKEDESINKVKCDICNIFISKKCILRHNKTKTHLENINKKTESAEKIPEQTKKRYTYFEDNESDWETTSSSESESEEDIENQPESLTYNDPKEVRCNICNIYLKKHNYQKHLQSKIHLSKIETKSK